MSLPPGRKLVTTRWSLVLAAGNANPSEARSALASLCETYWFPVYHFIRCTGHPGEEAKDLTQAFFARVLEKGYFGDARPERGRFRSFLLGAVRHFVANERDWQQALKRGGGQVPVPLEREPHDDRPRIDPADRETPEHVYERRWALAVLDDAMKRLGDEYEQRGKQALFRRIRSFLVGDETPAYAELVRDLRMTKGALQVAVHRLRRQFGESLRSVITETVESPGDVDEELRYLLTVLSR